MSDSVAMNNAVETPSTTLSEKCLSILEIKKRYRKLNQNLVEVMERFEDIIERECLDENDRKYLKNRDCSFIHYNVSQNDIELHGESLNYDLLESGLKNAIIKSIYFFDVDLCEWKNALLNYKRKFLEFEQDTTDLSIVLNKLYISMDNIFDNLNPEYVQYITFDFPIENTIILNDFDFNEIAKVAQKETDLIVRRNIFCKALADKNMLCLMFNYNPDTHNGFQMYKQKCNRAIQIIDDLIKNTSKIGRAHV